MREFHPKHEASNDSPFWKRYIRRKYVALKLGFRSIRLMFVALIELNWFNVGIRLKQIKLCAGVFFRLRHDK